MTKEELYIVICDLFKIEKPTKMMESQIYKFVTEHGYTYKDIARALWYFSNVKKQKLQLNMGLGIVPYIHEESTKYFERIKKQQQFLKNQGNKIKNEVNKRKTFKAKPERRFNKPQPINIEELR